MEHKRLSEVLKAIIILIKYLINCKNTSRNGYPISDIIVHQKYTKI